MLTRVPEQPADPSLTRWAIAQTIEPSWGKGAARTHIASAPAAVTCGVLTAMDDENEQLRFVALQNAHSILVTRRRAEAELLEAFRRTEERTNYALDAAHMAVWELDLLTREIT